MNMKFVYVTLIVLIFVGLIVARNAQAPHESTSTPDSPIDSFAKCISDAGAKFYGAYWCSHCQAQKKLFENSKYLPYVECSTASGQGQMKVCADLKVDSYPTWILGDGAWLNGEQSFATLSEKTGCALPASTTPTN